MFDIFSKENYFTSKSDEQNKETEQELKFEEIQNGNGIVFQIPQIFEDNDITFKITGIDFNDKNDDNEIKEYNEDKKDDYEKDSNEEDVENEIEESNEEEDDVENEIEEEDEVENEIEEEDEVENEIEEEENDDSDEEDENKIYLLKINDENHSYFKNKKEAQDSILSLARNIKLKDNRNFPDSYLIENNRNEIKVIRVFDFIFFNYHHLLMHFQLEKLYKF